MKKCPYCAEEIQDEAILCRYCGRAFGPIPDTPLPAIPIQASPSASIAGTKSEAPSPETILSESQTPVKAEKSNLEKSKPSTANPSKAGLIIGLIIASLLTLRHFVAGMAFLSQMPGAEIPARLIPDLFGSFLTGLLFEFGSALLIYALIGWLVAAILHKANVKFSTTALAFLGLSSMFVVVWSIVLITGYTGETAGGTKQLASGSNPTRAPVGLAPNAIVISTETPVPTARPTLTPVPRPSATPDCFSPEQVNASLVNSDVCVYGVLEIMPLEGGGSMVFIQSESGGWFREMVIVRRIPRLLPGLNGATCGKYYGPLVMDENGQFEMLRVTGMQYCDDPGIPPTRSPNELGGDSQGISKEDSEHLQQTRVQPAINAALTATARARE